MNKPILLDCTLRDGGYPIHFQFSIKDVKNITAGLESAGINYIEVGHGLGLGATSLKHGVAFETDEDYILSAKKSVTHAKIGAFFVVNIGDNNDLDMAKKSGLDFIRIGTNVTEVEQAFPYIEHALSLGLEVHLNLMKSYALKLPDFNKMISKLPDFSLASLYVVDSAGCMLPKEVSDYITAVTNAGICAGFHGHNNLNLANANCLAALEAGACFIDGTLRGMGRSTGNAQTEILAHLLNKHLSKNKYQVFKFFSVINNYVEPLMLYKQGQSSIDIVTGISKFHSSFLPHFKRVQSKYDVSLEELIIAVSEIDCINPQVQLIESVARDLS